MTARQSITAKADEPPVIPHRAAAVLGLGLLGWAACAMTIGAAALLRTGVLSVQDADGEMVLILGVIAMVCTVVAGLVAWAMANGDLKRMAAASMDPAGRRRTLVGRALAMVLVLAAAAVGIAAAALAMLGDQPLLGTGG